VLGVSEWMSVKDFFALLCAHLGVEGHYEHMSLEAFVVDDPLGVKVGFGQTVLFVEEFGFSGGNPDVLLPENVSRKPAHLIVQCNLRLTLCAARKARLFHPADKAS